MADTTPPTSPLEKQRLQRKSFSIRSRILLTVSLVLVLGLSAIGWSIDRMYASSLQAGIQERLTATLNLLVSSIEESQSELRMDVPQDPRLQQPGSNLTAGMRSQMHTWLSASTLQVQPGQWPHGPVGEQVFRRIDDFFADSNPQYVMSWELGWETDGGAVLPLHLWAAVDVDEYRQPLAAFRAGTWRWLAVLGVLLLFVQLLAGWLGMKPLRRVEREIIAIEQGTKAALDGCYPQELQALTDNLNALLISEKVGQQQYRKALGNLGHAMKTPLAVLNSILQQPDISAEDLEQARSAIRDLHGVMRFQIERAASAARRTLSQPIALAPQVERLLRSLRKIYPQVDIQADVETDSRFYGEQRDLLEVLGNLLENACKYGAGKVQLRARQLVSNKRKPGLLLSVGNNGEPLSGAQFERLLQRGQRGDERIDGDGLGLAIVCEIADAYQARLYSRRSELGGLEVVLELP